MKKHTLWLIEFVLWFTFIAVIVFGINYYHVYKVNNKSTYHIFLKDIDGLMKGSPVKIMGVQVGYVTEINVIDDYMYVSFFISKPNVTMPHGSKALIESYGIAGSKSIELYPPKNKADETKDLLFVKEPIRASSALQTRNDIARTIITVSKGTTAMLDTHTAQQHKKNIQKIAELSATDLDFIDEKSDALTKKLRKDIREKIKEDIVENSEEEKNE